MERVQKILTAEDFHLQLQGRQSSFSLKYDEPSELQLTIGTSLQVRTGILDTLGQVQPTQLLQIMENSAKFSKNYGVSEKLCSTANNLTSS